MWAETPRWFQRQLLRDTARATLGVKALVRRAANGRALVQFCGHAIGLHIATGSSSPDNILVLPAHLTYQLCLPLPDLDLLTRLHHDPPPFARNLG